MKSSKEKTKSIEYPQNSGIRILEKQNTTKGQSYGVSYQVTVPTRLTGNHPKRKQLPTLKAAKHFAGEQLRGIMHNGSAFFRLTTEEIQEIGLWIPKLKKKGISITEAMEFAVARLKPDGGERLVSEVIEESLDLKRKRNETGDLADATLKSFDNRSNRFRQAVGSGRDPMN